MNFHGADYLFGIESLEQIERIKQLVTTFPKEADTFAIPSTSVRSSHSAPIIRTSDTQWLYDELWRLVTVFNRRCEFQLEQLEEPVQLIRYTETGCVDWHIDVGGRADPLVRKLSMSVQLSASNEYAGGDLEFAAQAAMPFARSQGTVIGFPSYCAHRVTPVVSGERLSLVAFALGKPFV